MLKRLVFLTLLFPSFGFASCPVLNGVFTQSLGGGTSVNLHINTKLENELYSYSFDQQHFFPSDGQTHTYSAPGNTGSILSTCDDTSVHIQASSSSASGQLLIQVLSPDSLHVDGDGFFFNFSGNYQQKN